MILITMHRALLFFFFSHSQLPFFSFFLVWIFNSNFFKWSFNFSFIHIHFLKGGMPGSARLRDCKVLQKLTREQAEGKRFYGAICAAPAVTLLPWGLLKRKQVPCVVIHK